eukprot:gene16471-22693_t
MVSTAMTPKLNLFNAQDVANTLWALATLGYQDSAFLIKLVAQTRLKLQDADFNPQNMANSAWALAVLGHYDSRFLYELTDRAKPKLPSFSAQNVSNLAWSLATFSLLEEGLMAQLQEQEGLMAQFQEQLLSLKSSTPQHVATTALSMAKLGCPLNPALGSALATGQPGSFSTKDVCDLAWAQAVSGNPQQPWLLALVLGHVFGEGEGEGGGDLEGLDPDFKVQLFQYTSEVMEGDQEGLREQLAGEEGAQLQLLHASCQGVWEERVQSKSSTATTYVDSVTQVCNQLPGWEVLGQERLTDDKLYSMSVAVQVQPQSGQGKPMKVAVEVVGPRHYSRSTPYKQLGASAAKDRALERRGWSVLSVPFFEWAADKEEEEKKVFLTKALAALKYKNIVGNASQKASKAEETVA